jgi:hypothetical protein
LYHYPHCFHNQLAGLPESLSRCTIYSLPSAILLYRIEFLSVCGCFVVYVALNRHMIILRWL